MSVVEGSIGATIELRTVSRSYETESSERVVALSDVSLLIEARSVVAVTGPSGSGKSTLLHLIGAMDDPTAGSVMVGGVDLARLSRREKAEYRRRVGFVFQRFHLLPALTVLDNVAAPVLPYRTPFDKFARAEELLASVGLSGKERSLPSKLSGGQQQRVAIARALINHPGLLLADEPTGNLDSGAGAEIVQLLLQLRRERAVTVVVATHNPVVASRCDRIVRLQDGVIIDDMIVPDSIDPDKMLDHVRRLNPGG